MYCHIYGKWAKVWSLFIQEQQEEEERRQREKQERQAEEERLKREAKEREEEKQKKEVEEMKLKRAQDRLEALKKTPVGAKALADVTAEVRMCVYVKGSVWVLEFYSSCVVGAKVPTGQLLQYR